MTTTGSARPLMWIGGLLAALVALASAVGAFTPGTYALEVPGYAAQGVGQDWVNLVLIVPALVWSAWSLHRGSRRGGAVLGGTLLYTAYSYALYAFGLHFNSLFLVYCAILGLSVYGLIRLWADPASGEADRWYDESVPVRLLAGWQLLIALLFYAVWLAEVLPALLRGMAPRSVTENGLMVNPVHVLDLALLLPALIVSALSLLRRRALGYLLTPPLVIFAAFMAAAIAGMVIIMKHRGLESAWTVSALFGLLALISTLLASAFLGHVRPIVPDRASGA